VREPLPIHRNRVTGYLQIKSPSVRSNRAACQQSTSLDGMLYVQLPNFPLLNRPSPFMRSEELNVQFNVPYHLGIAVEFGKGCVHGLFCSLDGFEDRLLLPRSMPQILLLCGFYVDNRRHPISNW